MRKLIVLILLVVCMACTASAAEFTAPTVPGEVEKYFPEETDSFSEGLISIVKSVIGRIHPDLKEAAAICFSLIAVILIISVFQGVGGNTRNTIELTATVILGIILLKPSNSLIHYAIDTVIQLCEYGKLLFPVMTAALAAQGAVSSASALSAGTMFFITILSSCVSTLLIPMVYIYLAVGIAKSAVGEQALVGIHKFVKWLMTWVLKIILYVFTGYLSITGIVSGGVDASAIKAAKLTISGFVPVVGNIISDASEAILVSAGVMKNAAGVYGLLAIIAIWLTPFVKIGIHYLMLKMTAGICGVFGAGKPLYLIRDFSTSLGFVLAMIATVCVLLLISTVCFMKGTL